ncbi:RNA-binding protein Lupus La [Tanacetum coccineum]|uniref:RNA-binding protein Lupus La n=1 Tax=Tanacetum coccineum TaxID=301880 RepID=A0ABQ4YS29_9ASTR
MDVSLPNSGLQADPHIKSRVKTLKGNFSAMHDMVLGSSTSGFGWDPNKCVVTAPNDVWDAYVKTHPKAAGMRDKPFIYYHKLSTIFGKDHATGSRSEDLGEEDVVSDTEETTPTNCEDIDVNMGVNPSPEIVSGKDTKRKRSKTDEFIHIYSSTSDTLNNSINAIGKEMNINLSKMANDQERKL